MPGITTADLDRKADAVFTRPRRPSGRRPGKDTQAIWVDLRRRFMRVMDYIDANIDGCISVGRLADVADMSKFYFIRNFKDHVGETPGQTTLRLRMEIAKRRIAAGWKIKDVAGIAGYEHIQAFSTAFRDRFGLVPSRVDHVANLPSIPPRVVWLDDRTMIGIASDGSKIRFTSWIEHTISSLTLKNDGLKIQDFWVTMRQLPFLAPDGETLRLDDREMPISNDPVASFDTAVAEAKLTAKSGLDHVRFAGGPYLRIAAYGNWESISLQLRSSIDGIRGHGRFALRNGPILWRAISNPWFTPRSERLREIYLPLRPR